MFSVSNFSQWITDTTGTTRTRRRWPSVGKLTITPAGPATFERHRKAVGYGDGDTKFWGGVSFDGCVL